MKRDMKRNCMWMTWGVLSVIALLTIGYKSIAAELEKQNAQERPVVVVSPGGQR
jgi:hypothetical protein